MITTPLEQFHPLTNHKIKFELVGDWEKAIREFSSMGRVVKAASIAAQLKLGREIVKKVKGHLKKQDIPNWPPLNREYRRRKLNAGYGSDMLMMTQTYYDNITTWKVGNNNLVLIGVKRGIFGKTLSGKRSKIEVAAYAWIQERTVNLKQRRPLWDYTIQEDLGGKMGIEDTFLLYFYKQLKIRQSNIQVQKVLRKYFA